MGGEIRMKWMNKIKIVASKFRGNESKRENFTGGQKTAPLIGDESRWNSCCFFGGGCTAEWL